MTPEENDIAVIMKASGLVSLPMMAAVSERYPLTGPQTDRFEQMCVAFAECRDLNGLRIIADKPDVAVLFQVIRFMFDEQGNPRSFP